MVVYAKGTCKVWGLKVGVQGAGFGLGFCVSARYVEHT